MQEATEEDSEIILSRIKERQYHLESLSVYLEELESQLTLLFTYSPDLIVLARDSGEIIKVNRTAERILGYSPDEMVGKNVWDFIAEEDRKETIKFRQSIMEEGGGTFFVKNDIFFINHWKKKNGTYARLVWRYAFFDKNNKWVIKFATDFSDMPVDNPFIHNLVIRSIEYARAGFVITDNTNKENPIIYANKAFCDYSGFERDDIIGKNCRILNKMDRDQRALETVRKAIDNGAAVDVLLKNFKPDGSPWYNFLVMEPVIENGIVTKFIGSSRDVTKQVEDSEIKWDRNAVRGFGKI